MQRVFLSSLALLLLSGSQFGTLFSFSNPIDALSIGINDDTIDLTIHAEGTIHPLILETESDPLLRESNLVTFNTSIHNVYVTGTTKGFELHPIRVAKDPIRFEVAARNRMRTPTILNRRGWGANDELLFQGAPVSRSDEPRGEASTPTTTPSKRVQDCEDAQRNHPADFRTEKTVTHETDGRRFRWARRYSNDIKLLVIHHTAQKVTGDTRPAVERVRALYEYHADSLGWGDIGYHYLIDEHGQIYEGRSGGEYVVGGHAYCGNVGTIGIALLGDFEKEVPRQKQMVALRWLLDDLANRYDINLRHHVTYHGKRQNAILGHKDLIATECPGYYITSALSQIRETTIAGNFETPIRFPTISKKSRKDRTVSRYRSRLQSVSKELPRRVFRARRLGRVAERLSSATSRISQLQKQRQEGTNVQRKRSARRRRREQRQVGEPQNRTSSDTIRIRLGYRDSVASLFSNTPFTINGREAQGEVRLGREGNTCQAVVNGTVIQSDTDGIRMTSDAVLTVTSWDTPFNQFRNTIECRIVDGELTLINVLPLEAYMQGLAEEPDTESFEKQKVFAIAARSYAAHYMEDRNRKFPGKPYDGNDSPASFQSYRGYVYERKNPQWVQAVRDTARLVLKKDGQILKAAYFSSSDGRTRSPEENGWKNFPMSEVFQSKDDPWCKGLTLHGHGVGMSGCGAKGQVKEGRTVDQVLEYYYPGTTIEKR